MVVDKLLDELVELYPVDRLLTNKAALITYESDALTSFKRTPRAVVIAETKRK